MLLLHGFAGNETNWTGFTRIQEFVRDLPLVVVMPQGHSAWYVNAKAQPADRYEEFIMSDLRTSMADRYGVDTSNLSIAGLSMGGYGTLVLALKHPRAFVFAAPLSSSLDIPMGIPELEQNGRQGMRPELERAFGKDSSGFWASHDPFTLASLIDTAGAPYFYIATGIQDEFTKRLAYHRSFVEILRTRGFRYEYHETPGRHNWEYWGREIEGVLRAWSEVNGVR
jgi:S-formylglutathione hydrolase FrmB